MASWSTGPHIQLDGSRTLVSGPSKGPLLCPEKWTWRVQKLIEQGRTAINALNAISAKAKKVQSAPAAWPVAQPNSTESITEGQR